MNADLPRLILHFDVNATIIITDPAARLSLDDAIEKALQQPDWDASTIYSARGQCTTSGITKETLLQALKWPEGIGTNDKLCNGQYHFIFPSFFNTVTELLKANRTFTIIFRTFGSDLDRISNAMNEFASGNHPQYKYDGCEELHISRVWKGSYGDGRYPPEGGNKITRKSEAHYTLTSRDENNCTTTLDKEEDIGNVFESRTSPRSAVACQDDHEWWKFHKKIPSSGKPMWITENDENVQHIFFDDCIRKSAVDSIVAVRHRKSAGDEFQFMSGEEIINLHGCHTVRVQTIDAIMDHDYFMHEIKECEEAWRSKRKIVS